MGCFGSKEKSSKTNNAPPIATATSELAIDPKSNDQAPAQANSSSSASDVDERGGVQQQDISPTLQDQNEDDDDDHHQELKIRHSDKPEVDVDEAEEQTPKIVTSKSNRSQDGAPIEEFDEAGVLIKNRSIQRTVSASSSLIKSQSAKDAMEAAIQKQNSGIPKSALLALLEVEKQENSQSKLLLNDDEQQYASDNDEDDNQGHEDGPPPPPPADESSDDDGFPPPPPPPA